METKKGAWIVSGFEDILRTNLNMLEYRSDMSICPGEKRFVYGDTKDEKVFKLEIEGQEPTEIIPYQCFGETRYFWYYEDLESDKPGSQLEFTVE